MKNVYSDFTYIQVLDPNKIPSGRALTPVPPSPLLENKNVINYLKFIIAIELYGYL